MTTARIIPARRAARPLNVVSSLLVVCITLWRGQASLASGLSIPSPDQSAGVFIGIEKFSYDFSLEDVSFAVNDAVDLAHALVIEHRMLPANRVLLLIAGEPLGAARDRLRSLEAAGVRRESARQADIYALVREQSRLVEDGGILVLSIATHGFSDGGEHLLMAEDSLLEFRTGVTAENLLQAAEAGSAGFRLLLLDACREQLVRPSRRGGSGRGPDLRSVMRTELVETLARQGYAVFSAASTGQWAYSDDANGFFTGAILRGLGCREGEEVKTLRELYSVAGADVVTKSHGSQQPELRIGGGVEDIGLFRCRGEAPPPPPMPPTVPPAAFTRIRDAERFLAVGGLENVEQAYLLYRQTFEKELPQEILSTLNQGLMARARQLGPDAERNEAIRLYRQLFAPLLAQFSAQRP